MLTTSKAFRIALTAALLSASAATAGAKPRRVVILDFDGPRGLADSGREEVVTLLGEQYDIVATKRWEDARAAAQQRAHGPQTWSKAAKKSGVDAVIEGWIQDEGRHKVLTVAVREASSGNEIDTVSVKLSQKGLSPQNKHKLQTELDGVLEYIEGSPEPYSSLRVIETRPLIGAKQTRSDDAPAGRSKKKTVAEVEDAQLEDADAAPKKKKTAKRPDEDAAEESVAEEPEDAAEAEESGDGETQAPRKKNRQKDVAATSDAKENEDLVSLFGATSDEGKKVDPSASHTPVPTPKFRIGGGGYYASRTLTFEAENQTGPMSYPGVPHKGLQVQAEVYPFPLKKMDGDLSGIGFSFSIGHSAGSVVTFDDGESVGEYNINQSQFDAGIHWRQPLGSLVSLDGHVSYGRNTYIISDAPETFEVPDTEYSYIGGGAALDLNIADRASVGFGAKYFYLLDVGDISSVDWYGPGRASGYGLDGTFVIPLPKQLYLRGNLGYTKYSIDFDGVGQITEDEGVVSSSDGTVQAQVDLGIAF